MHFICVVGNTDGEGFFTSGKDFTVYVAMRVLWFLLCPGTASLVAVTGQCGRTFTHPCVTRELRMCLADKMGLLCSILLV